MPAAPDDATLSRLSLTGVACRCHIGVTEEERRERQRIEFDLDLYADLEAAGRTADLSRTVDYRDVAQEARGLLEGRPFHLVEAAAAAVLDRVLERYPPVRRAVVRVRKYVLADVAAVEVEMERRR